MSAPPITCRPAHPIVFYPSRCGCSDKNGKAIKEEQGVLRRTVMWRPFIVDLRDTRLAPHEPRTFTLTYSAARYPGAKAIEAVVYYHLVDEARRRRIDYRSTEPIDFEIYHKRLPLGGVEDAS